jgi:hypothetical protein
MVGPSNTFVNAYLAPEMPWLCVANLRNSWLLRAIRAFIQHGSGHNLRSSRMHRRGPCC